MKIATFLILFFAFICFTKALKGNLYLKADQDDRKSNQGIFNVYLYGLNTTEKVTFNRSKIFKTVTFKKEVEFTEDIIMISIYWRSFIGAPINLDYLNFDAGKLSAYFPLKKTILSKSYENFYRNS